MPLARRLTLAARLILALPQLTRHELTGRPREAQPGATALSLRHERLCLNKMEPPISCPEAENLQSTVLCPLKRRPTE